MEAHNLELQTLLDLGLTSMQARIFLALAESGPSKIAAISKLSRVDRPDVYRTLSTLQKLGLAEKIIQKPIQFRAIPMKEGLSLLLRVKAEQYKKMELDARLLMDSFKDGHNVEAQKESFELFMISDGKMIVSRIREAIELAQRRVDLVLSWKRFWHGMVFTFAESVDRARAKGVQFRFIIGKPETGRNAEELIQSCRKSSFCQIRFLRSFPKTILGIYDGNAVFVILNPRTDLPDSPALWSNNPSLIAMAQGFFDALWSKATRDLP